MVSIAFLLAFAHGGRKVKSGNDRETDRQTHTHLIYEPRLQCIAQQRLSSVFFLQNDIAGVGVGKDLCSVKPLV